MNRAYLMRSVSPLPINVVIFGTVYAAPEEPADEGAEVIDFRMARAIRRRKDMTFEWMPYGNR